jgi:predicted nucleic acid-binding protein
MVMMAARVFLDTNVLLRALLIEMELHRECDQILQRLIQEKAELWVNGQVIREFLVQTSHPKTLKKPLSFNEAVQQLDKIKPIYKVADDTEAVRQNLLMLLERYPTQGRTIHDVNIVATMLAYDIPTLVTLNIADMKRFADRIQLRSVAN